MADASTTLAVLQDEVRQFAVDRAWEPYHNPKNLAMALSVEGAELMELFLWRTADESFAITREPTQREAVADELADVLTVLLHLGRVLGIDLSDALRAKLVKNQAKYPVAECLAREAEKRSGQSRS